MVWTFKTSEPTPSGINWEPSIQTHEPMAAILIQTTTMIFTKELRYNALKIFIVYNKIAFFLKLLTSFGELIKNDPRFLYFVLWVNKDFQKAYFSSIK